MEATITNTGIPLSSINPWYLHTNSTSHTWPFSAIAELIDNAYDPDVSAKQFWIDKTEFKGKDCLIFMDNGKGMDFNMMYKLLSFGFSDKQTVKGHDPVGIYGNGFKSGSMRLGKDAIVFSKKANTMCVGLLSQSYLQEIKAHNVIVPIVMFTNNGQTVSVAPGHEKSLRDILTHSLFNTKEELLSEFNVIDGLRRNSSGTRIIIWNLRRTLSDELEFDFTKDRYDIQIPFDVYKRTRRTKKQQLEAEKWMPECEYSLRAYCSILYLKPRMQIIIRSQKVEAQFITKSLAHVIKDSYRPHSLGKAMKITFGYNTKSKEHFGLMMYHKNRLIKAYERVPCQRRANSTGVGVIGVIECNYLTPTHNKQDFDNTEEYRKTMLSVGTKLEDYWKEVGHRHKKILHCTEPIEDLVKRPDQIWVQCDDCLKWRKLPDGIVPDKLPKNWFCHMNTDPKFRSCKVEEEPEDSDDEQRKYKKTYKKDKKKQKLQEEEGVQCHTLNIQMTPSPPDATANILGTSSITTTASRKRTQDLSEENPEKKARRKDSLPDLSTCLSALFSQASDANKAECKEIKTPLKNEDDDNVSYKGAVMKGKLSQITTPSFKDQSYKVLYPQAKKEINQDIKKELKEEVVIIEDEDCHLSTYKQSRSGDERGLRNNQIQPHFVCTHACQFHCKLTNLIFEMKGKGEVFCTTKSWDKSQLQGISKYQPAGPLYKITCSEGSILYLYLPHCEVHTDKKHIELAVAHFSEGNMEIRQPLKVTNTHVIIEVQHLSLFGLLKKWITPETSINAQVLLFYQAVQQRKKLYIHLLPGNVPVKEVQNQQEGSTYIQCSSICQLTPGKKYKPSCTPHVSQPRVATFLHDYGPNYHPTFEVILNSDIQDLTLVLLDEKGNEVWEPHHVLLTADRRGNVSGAEFVDLFRDILIQRVLLVMEIADTLLTKGMISNEMYNDIEQATTSQEKMRILYRALDSGGRAMKSRFYEVLKEKQPFLVRDLEFRSDHA